MKTFRLIWFQHFHKVGGTSVTNLAKRNNETLYPNNSNGNPLDNNGNLIKVWNYSALELKQFIDSCEKKGITLISTEWGLPILFVLVNDPRVTLITCLRDPLERFVSNYFYDLYWGHTDCLSLEEYINSANKYNTITMFNYFCRMLTGRNNEYDIINQAVFDKALQAIKSFDCCVTLEHNFDLISRRLGWKHQQAHSNKSAFSLRKAVNFIWEGKAHLLIRRLKYPKRIPSDAFIKYFKMENCWDIKLYNEAITFQNLL